MSYRVIGAGGGGCFPAGVKVMTPFGETPIEQLAPGDEVLSFDATGRVSTSKVEKLHTHDRDQVLRCRFWGGSFRVTGNHWVLNQYNTFVEIRTLTEHDAIVDSLGHLRPVLGFDFEGEEPVYNLTVVPDHTFIADGIRVHNGGRGASRPAISGAGGGGGDKGGGGHVPVEDPDSLRSHQYASVLDLVSEGEIGGLVNGLASVYVNDTPVMNSDGTYNFGGVTVDTRNGTQIQNYIPGFSDVESEFGVGAEATCQTVGRITRSTAYALNAVYACPTLPWPVLFQCTSAGVSGIGEPTWPNTVGATVSDGAVTWTAVSAGIRRSTSYGLGTVLPVAGVSVLDYQCVTAGTTAATEPSWPVSLNATVTDGTVVWKAVYKSIQGAVTRSITDPNVNAVVVTLEVPSLTYQDASTGDLHGSSVQIAIDLQTSGGGFVAQPVSYSWSTATAVSGAVTLVTADGYGIGATIKVTPGTAPAYDTTTGTWVTQVVPAAWMVEYQEPGSSTWTTINNTSAPSPFIKALWSFMWAADGESVNSYESAVKSYGTWKLRVTTTDGYSTAKITAVKSATANMVDTISGKTTSRYRRAYRIPVTGAGPWDIRVRRITEDSTKSNLQNKTYVSSYTEVIEQKLRYPNCALVALRIDAAQFTAIPNRGYEIYGLLVQVPSNYNPFTRTYTGTWDGTFVKKWTDNPAWVYYDVCTNTRYGLGKLINTTVIDKWSLYNIGKYCDELVPTGLGSNTLEPRFTCNIYIQTQKEAIKLLNEITSIFRGMSYWSAGQITAVADMPTDPVALFTAANVVDGAFTYTGSSRKARHTVALVTWNDPADRYRQKIEYVEDPDGISRYGIIQTDITAVGCVSRGQAHRVGKWVLYTERMETEVVVFRTALEGAFLRPGAVIKTQDANRAGARLAGRTVAVTPTSVEIDKEVTLLGGIAYTLSLMMSDGTIATCAIINGGVGSTTSTLTWTSALSTPPAVGSIWVLESSALSAELWKVISVVEADDINIEITAAAHDPSKYNLIEKDIVTPAPVTSAVGVGAPPIPTDLNITEALYTSGPGTIGTKVHLSWSSDADRFEVKYRAQNGNYRVESVTTGSLDIVAQEGATYEIQVRAINSLGERSGPARTTYAVLGKLAPPSDVPNFSVSIVGSAAHLTWGDVGDLDLAGYRIRYSPQLSGAGWGGAIDLAPALVPPGGAITVPALSGTFMIKAVDTGGRESVNETLATSNIAAVEGLNTVATITESPSFLGVMTETEVRGGALRLSSSADMEDWASLSGLVSLDYSSTGLSEEGTYEFHNTLDLGATYTSRLTAGISVSGEDIVNVMSVWPTLTGVASLSGANPSEYSVEIQVQTTNDDPLGTPTWTGWTRFIVGDYTARAFRWQVVLRALRATTTPKISELSVTVDMPDRVDAIPGIVCPSGGMTVTFPRPFKATPALGISAQNLAPGDTYVLSNQTPSGFDIQFKNGATGISRTFDCILRGYGAAS